jgi:hypothetical protein
MSSSGMLRRVALLRADVSEVLSAANNFPSSPILVTLMMEALSSSTTSVLTRATGRNVPEDDILLGEWVAIAEAHHSTAHHSTAQSLAANLADGSSTSADPMPLIK